MYVLTQKKTPYISIIKPEKWSRILWPEGINS